MQTRDKTKYICFVYDNRKSAPTVSGNLGSQFSLLMKRYRPSLISSFSCSKKTLKLARSSNRCHDNVR